MANTNFPPQSSKVRRIKRFGENISQLSLGIDVSHLNVSLLNVISQEVVPPLKVSPFVEDWNFGYRDGTGVVAHEGNSLKDHSKIPHGVHNPQDLGAVATYSASMVDCATKLFSRRPATKRRSDKMTSTKSSLSVNPTTHKISTGKANKIKQRRSRIPNPELRRMFEVPEDSLNCCPM
jgi:hypothetical protein